MAVVMLSSFGVFMLALAQTSTITEACRSAGITDTVLCDSYMSRLSTTSTNTATTTTLDTGANTTSGTTAPVVACTDSDAQDVFVTGYVSTAGSVLRDLCTDAMTVQEQYCDAGGPKTLEKRCDTGFHCADGRCQVDATVNTAVSGTTVPPTTTAITAPIESCTDTDGGDVASVRGSVTYLLNGVQATFVDACASSTSIQEEYCSGTKHVSALRTCGDNARCSEGVCTAVPASGVTAVAPLVSSTKAVCGNAVCETSLAETVATCAVDCTVTNVATPTAAVVADVPVATTVAQCADTDNGKTYSVRGIVSVGSVAYADRCADPATLQEQYCEGGRQYSETRPCGTGMRCLEGSCVKEEPVAATSVSATSTATTAAGAPAATAPLPDACVKAGVTSVSACKEYLEKRAVAEAAPAAVSSTTQVITPVASALPAKCVEKGITDPSACEAYVRAAQAATANAPTVVVPEECRARGLTDKDACQKYFADLAILPECRAKGATTVDACKALLAVAATAGVSDACKSASIYSAAGCQEHQLAEATAAANEAVNANAAVIVVPERCVKAGVTDADACTKYLAYADLPLECLRAGIESKPACEALLRRKYLDPACASNGITDEQACKEFVFSRVAATVTCDGLDASRCATTVKERHLGTVLDANVKIGDIQARIKDAAGADGRIDVAKLAEEGGAEKAARLAEVLPIKSEGRKLLAIASDQQLSLGADDTVNAAAATLIALDTDGDGTPDDMEKHLGLDPYKADTKEDVQRQRGRMAPIERAIADGKTIGQPLTQGTPDARLTVKLPEPTTTAPEGSAKKGTAFAGTGVAGTVVTLYVYSELPVVVTTTVDANGQWSYAFDDSLSEGTHEVYVAINDDTGKVVSKSNPLSFLVQGASAATTAQAAETAAQTDISPFVAAQELPKVDIKLFLLGGVALVLLAFGLVAALFRKPAQVR